MTGNLPRASRSGRRWPPLLLLVLLASIPGHSQEEGRDWSIFLPPDPSRSLALHLCRGCHDLQPVVLHRGDRRDWADSIRRMNSEGADVRPGEAERLSGYFSRYFSKTDPVLVPPLDVNGLTLEEFRRIPPLAPKAGEIVGIREARGGFQELRELLEVDGIGEEVLEAVGPFLKVGPGDAEVP